jgi:hypothetical protein
MKAPSFFSLSLRSAVMRITGKPSESFTVGSRSSDVVLVGECRLLQIRKVPPVGILLDERLPARDVTTHPTADWIARQITEAFPWNEAPRYLIRDRDRVYETLVRRLS